MTATAPETATAHPCDGHDTADLADHVHDHMTEVARDDATSSFTVHRHRSNGTAAVTFSPGVLDAYTAVLRWTLPGWAERLRECGFTVQVKRRTDRGTKAVPQWLRITAWTPPNAPTNDKQGA
ncbi:MAG: hypothetical protein YHS30scaffold324_26 [Catenulispora phage 69_17]|nr:MAG: hypothetical protein YHS30scaffold324_26 [Catenulispora phage 69_17]